MSHKNSYLKETIVSPASASPFTYEIIIVTVYTIMEINHVVLLPTDLNKKLLQNVFVCLSHDKY